MAIGPNVNDPNHGKVKEHIKKLQNSNSAQAGDQLKQEFNMGEKERVKVATAVQVAEVTGKSGK